MKEYTKTTLKNGTTVLLVPNNSTTVLTVMVMLGVGSRNEEARVAGVSHLLEHLHYMGTKKRQTPMQIAEFIESVGGEHNAFTSKEYTGYYTKITPKHLDDALDFLSDNLLNSNISEDDIIHEKDVIKQEINMYDDLPPEVCSNKFEEVVFGNNALGRDIIGTKESLYAATRQEIVNYKDSHYISSNAVIVLAGNTGGRSLESIVNLLEKSFTFSSQKSASRAEVVLNNKKNFEIISKDTAQAQISIGFKTIKVEEKDSFVLDLLSTLLGGAMSSRMFQEIREKRKLAYFIRTSTSNYKESGFLTTQAGVNEGKAIEAVKAIIEQYSNIKKTEVPEKELARAKEVLNGKMLIKFENSEELAYHFATDYTLMGNVHTPLELAAIYNSITAGDILRVANQYFNDDRMGLCFVGKALDKQELEKVFKI